MGRGPHSGTGRQASAIQRHENDPRRALLRLQLPVRPDPGSYRDWTWVACPISLPPTVPPGAVLHLPALRFQNGTVRADLACTHAVPKVARSGHTVALGVDWGLNTLLSAVAARLHDDGRITAQGAGAMFRAAGVLAKQHRLRRLGERLQARADQYQRIIDGRTRHGLRADTALEAKRDLLQGQISALSRRRSNLNDALAWSAARWIAVVTVPARGTSKNCPRCLAVLRHCKAPDHPGTRDWKWARCVACGWQGDRDQGAWQRIAARGLAHQATTVTDRVSGSMAVRSVADKLEATAVVTAPETRRKEPVQDRAYPAPFS